MKILSAKQLRDADEYTIKNKPVESIDLMEHASLAFVNWFVEQFDSTNTIKVFCGTGNNGGDGLAISRLLSHRGYHVETFVVRVSENQSTDFSMNYDRLIKAASITEIKSSDHIPTIKKHEIVVDGIFGSGLSREVGGLFAEVIQTINQSGATVVSIDIPSGLFCDARAQGENIIIATQTVSFQLPKLAFFLPSNYQYVGCWHVVDIGLDKGFIADTISIYHTLDESLIKQLLKPKYKNDHKGSNGKALLIAGSYGKIGAALLAGKGALRSGVGLLTIHAPQCGYDILQTSIPEAMISPDTSSSYFSEIPGVDHYDVIGVGPGLDTKPQTVKAYTKLMKLVRKPMVIDADAINILSTNPQLLKILPQNSILTPHHKEFERLVGRWSDDTERISKQLEFSKRYQVIVAFKGANTTISTPQGVIYFNTTGNPGMAKGGNGDVLTGIITGILAQGHTPLEATQLGVYLHGLAGDNASKVKGVHSMIASDIVDFIPEGYKNLLN